MIRLHESESRMRAFWSEELFPLDEEPNTASKFSSVGRSGIQCGGRATISAGCEMLLMAVNQSGRTTQAAKTAKLT